MSQITPQLLRADEDRTLEDVDRRIRIALTAAADAAGFKARLLMASAIERGAPRDHGRAARAYFGRELETVLALISPLLTAMNKGIPGFNEWLDRTGYGDDVLMIRALLAWCEHDPETAAIASRLQHGLKGLQ